MGLFQVSSPEEVGNKHPATALAYRYHAGFMNLMCKHCTELSAIVNIKLMDQSDLLRVKTS